MAELLRGRFHEVSFVMRTDSAEGEISLLLGSDRVPRTPVLRVGSCGLNSCRTVAVKRGLNSGLPATNKLHNFQFVPLSDARLFPLRLR